MIFSGIAYLATGEKIKEWFWEIISLFYQQTVQRARSRWGLFRWMNATTIS